MGRRDGVDDEIEQPRELLEGPTAFGDDEVGGAEAERVGLFPLNSQKLDAAALALAKVRGPRRLPEAACVHVKGTLARERQDSRAGINWGRATSRKAY